MFASLRKLRHLLDRRAAMQFSVMLAAIIFMAILEMTGVASILPFMKLVASPEQVETDPRLAWAYDTFGFTSARGLMMGMGILVLVIFAVSTLFSAFTTWLIQRCVWSMAHRMCMRLLKKYVTLPYRFHLEHNSADLTKKVLVDVNDLVNGVLLAGSNLVAQAILSLLLFGLMLVVRPGVALAAFFTLAGAYGVIHLARHRYLARLGRERLDASYGRLSTFTEAMTGVKTIRIEGAAPFFIRRFEDASRQFADLQPRYQLVRLTPRFVIELVAFGGLVIVVLLMLSTGQELLRAVPALSFFVVASYKLLPALNRVFQAAAQLSHHLPAVDAVVKDLEVETEEPVRALLAGGDTEALPFAREVRLHDVAFQYEAGRPVLGGIDLVVEKGASVALIGATGCGKTTLVDVMIGLLPATSGTLSVDGTEVTPRNASGWRQRIAYVPQDIFLYDDMITRNIAFGVEPDAIDQVRLEEAARVAQLDVVVSELPDGYETVIGERGVRLSGGQRQRIGLARAFYRRPDLLVLDEATSALDGVTEQALLAAIRAHRPDVTLLMISHRISSIRMCERIHLLDDGRLVASGTYDELLETSARMRELVESTS